MKIAAIIFVIIVLAAFPVNSFAQTNITIDPNNHFQTITGWETVHFNGNTDLPEFGFTGQDAYNLLESYKWLLADKIVNEAGLTRVRLEIGSGTENDAEYFTPYINGLQPRSYWGSHRHAPINDNDDPHVINWNGFHFGELDFKIESSILPFKQALEANGEKLYVNLNYVDFGATAFEHCTDNTSDNCAEYGEFMLGVFKHMERKYGFVPDAIEVKLEPDNNQDASTFGNSAWYPHTFKKAVKAAGDRLTQEGYHPDFIVPSTLSMNSIDNYFEPIIEYLDPTNSGKLPYVSEISYHLYSRNDDMYNYIRQKSAQYAIGASMLEWWTSNNDYTQLHKDLKLGRNTAWQQGTMANVWNPNNLVTSNYYAVDLSVSPPTITISHNTKFTQQYFKYIRPGAKRIGAITSGCTNDQLCSDPIDPLAFINSDGGYVVVVKATSEQTFVISGLPSGTYGITHTVGTNDSQWGVNQPNVTISNGQNLNAGIPNAGVITIYSKSLSNMTSTPTISKPGDANGDGHVNGFDYVYWLNNFNKNVSGGSTDGDFDNSVYVDGVDYVIWWQNFGS